MFAGGVDTSATETKGTVLIQSAEQVSNICFAQSVFFCLFNISLLLFSKITQSSEISCRYPGYFCYWLIVL